MKLNNLFKIIVTIGVSESAGLIKPALNPPSWVFGNYSIWTLN